MYNNATLQSWPHGFRSCRSGCGMELHYNAVSPHLLLLQKKLTSVINGLSLIRQNIADKKTYYKELSETYAAVDYLKGTLQIESAPGAGTTINIEFHVS